MNKKEKLSKKEFNKNLKAAEKKIEEKQRKEYARELAKAILKRREKIKDFLVDITHFVLGLSTWGVIYGIGIMSIAKTFAGQDFEGLVLVVWIFTWMSTFSRFVPFLGQRRDFI